MPAELHELHERAERTREHPDTIPITVTLAILAVLVAATGLLGHRAHTEALLAQTRATDQWAYYQARNIRLHGDQVFLDELAAIQPKDSPALARLRDSYQRELARYRGEAGQLQAQARALEAEVAGEQRRANRFDLGELLLEASIVIVSIALMVARRFYWLFGMAIAAAGVAIASTGLFI
ncbi:MAG TPA: DUF4337 domain-containing protein [Candidatus Acidoferrales bacterium]|nr:DUF4337 domain-containing protein [Candidatus Acidoferrales bacterium]